MTNPKSTFYFNLSTADHIGVGFFKYNLYPNQGFIIVNNAFANILGYKYKTDIKKKDFLSFFISSLDKKRFIETLKKEGKVSFFETLFKRRGRNRAWIAITAAYIKSKSFEYIEGIIENITAHHEMEEKLELERDYMQNLLDNIPDAIYFKDKYNRIIKVNRFYAQGLGLKPQEIIGKTDFDFFPQEQARRMFEDDTEVVRTGKSIIGKVERTLLPNGSWNQVITTKIPMYDKDGQIIGTMGVTRDMTAYANLEKDRLGMVMNGLNILVKALGMRDPYTFSHTQHVSRIVECIGKELGWDENRVLGLRVAAELHDLGKISIPMDILNKPGRLSELEQQFIREHVAHCYSLIKDIDFPFPLAETVYQHHERMDGSGYPHCLQGENILLEARILAISDVLEAMTYHRPYRAALGVDKAQGELKRGAGSKYDTNIVEVVFDLLNKNGNKPFWMYE